jgi:predicted O-methyltransferase YrrM
MATTWAKKWKRTVHRIVSIPDALTIRSYREIHGFLSPREAVALYQTARRVGPSGTIVEIGSWKGKSTYCLAKGLRSGRVIAIDPFNCFGDQESAKIYDQTKGEAPLIEQFRRNMATRGVLARVDAWQGTSGDFLERIAGVGGIDLLFIDGDHSIEGCDFDFRHYSPHLKPGGYLMFHDFDKTRAELGPTWVIDQRVRPSGEYEFVALYDTLWTRRKRRG